MFKTILGIARKEFRSFFSSPIAFIFIGVFLVSSFFIFFYVDKFFGRNIADIRPLFHWMPLLLIFLVSALTMRMWSEERRMGTIELLMTSPVKPLELVLGKFLACCALVALSLALTISLPITVEALGEPDWGPIIGGYLASLFLAAAYIAIGLYISTKTDNQLVSLILSFVACLAFYLLGSGIIVDLFPNRIADFLRSLSTSARFEAIERGRLDLRDIYYYLSLVGVFITLTVYSLTSSGWSTANKPLHSKMRLAVSLLALNFFDS